MKCTEKRKRRFKCGNIQYNFRTRGDELRMSHSIYRFRTTGHKPILTYNHILAFYSTLQYVQLSHCTTC